MTTFDPTFSGKVIYLDQKCWINLAKIHYGSPTEDERIILDTIIEASERGSAIFPLFMSHVDETCRIADPKRRERLASLMVQISNGYAITPYVEPIMEAEIRNIVLKKMGVPVIDLRNHVLGKGIPHLLGIKPEIVKRDGSDKKPPEEIKKKMFKILNSLEALKFILTHTNAKESIRRNPINCAEQMEVIRQKLHEIEDNDFRRRVFFARNVSAMIVPKLVKILIKFGLPKDYIINNDWTLDDMNKFLDNIPTATCQFTLIFQRDQQLQRPIQANDMNDLWFLTLTIPYCDIVVTENMWASISKQAKLDRKYDTIILPSIKELNRYL